MALRPHASRPTALFALVCAALSLVACGEEQPPTFAEAGGLAHYSPDGRAFYDRTADFVARILKGARPSELPVEEPTSYEFVVNLKTAKAIGLRVPQDLLLRATRVIE